MEYVQAKYDLVKENKSLLEAYDLNSLALEKQIVKRPKIKRGQVCDSKVVCPICGIKFKYHICREDVK